MPRASRQVEIYREDARHGHKLLTPQEREQLIQPFLPIVPPNSQPEKKSRRSPSAPKTKSKGRFGVRVFLWAQLYTFLFNLIHIVFSLYVRIRQIYHSIVARAIAVLFYHHRTPELIKKDVKGLKRLPQHLSVVLKLEDVGSDGEGLEVLVDQVSEVAAWCACVGIPMLSVYERTGILKQYIPGTHRAATRKLSSYFGSATPALSVRAPHVPAMETPAPLTRIIPASPRDSLSILLISEEDGCDSIVDLTKTLAEMAQKSKLSPSDISIELVDAELSESVMGEPDLLVLFSPVAELSGYPPWQIRLTEIFHIQDNNEVGYQVFLRALYNYADAQMRLGR